MKRKKKGRKKEGILIMSSCPRCNTKMEEILTKAGVVIDNCKSCKSIWLDQGEINFFAKTRKLLSEYELRGLKDLKDTNLNCPSCHSSLKIGTMPNFNFEIEECVDCKGILLDYSELKKIISSGKFNKIKTDSKVSFSSMKSNQKRVKPVINLPSLALTSGAVLLSMYGLLFGLFVFLTRTGHVPYSTGMLFVVGFVLLQFILGPVLMDWSLRLFGSLDWVHLDSLPSHFSTSLKKLCKKNNLPLPKVGIINDGSPQAYTYGRTPLSARVVFSAGMFEILNEEELEAVLAHELGHVKHWDFVVMTLAQLVPIILYHIYRFCIDSSRTKSKNGRSRKQGLIVAAVVAYVAYIIAEYLLMFVSRLREYYADKFSCYATKNPNALLTALVKIGFGMASSKEGARLQADEAKSNKQKRMAIQAMGIMNISSSKSMALAFQGNVDDDETDEVQSIKEIMRWDLWSPWASYYELHSTHPLTSKRINAIGAHALNMGQEPILIFDLEKPESYWDDFIVDLFVILLPVILGIGFAAAKLKYMSLGMDKLGWYEYVMPFVFGLSIGGLIKTTKAYAGGKFLTHSISSLLRKVKVSPVRSYPIKLKGHIIGRGDAGNMFSEDMVLRDKTGLIFLNHEPFGFNFFFALFRTEKFIGKEVVVEGWYRRSPVPYVEVSNIRSSSDSSSSYTYFYKIIGWCLLPTAVYIANLYFNS